MTQESPTAAQSIPPRGLRAATGWGLLSFIVMASAAVGWVAGRGLPASQVVIVPASYEADAAAAMAPEVTSLGPANALIGPVPGPARPGPVSGDAGDAGDAGAGAAGVSPAEVGRLKAEMLRLRVLFKRLAGAAQLDDDGEFDVDFEIDSVTGDGEPLSALDPASRQAMALLIERFDPMLDQSDLMAHIFDERHTAWSQRVSGQPLPNGVLSSGFGPRLDPVSGLRVMHHGLDFVAPMGSPVHAVADGVVTWSGPNGAYGLLVELEHVDGFRTRYAHNDSTVVELGQRVRKGEPIAALGSSGRSTGPHLHLEVRQHGQALDPRLYIR